MIRSIEMLGKTYTADWLIEAGLPECLYCCLDGSTGVYHEASVMREDEREALKKVFSYPNITPTLEKLLASFRVNCDKKDGVFLFYFMVFLGSALSTRDPFLELSAAQAKDIQKKATDAVMTLKSLMQQCGSITENWAINSAIRNVEDEFKDRELYVKSLLQNMALKDTLDEAGIELRPESFLDNWLEMMVLDRIIDPVARPGRGDIRRRHFCAVMAMHLERWLGSPMIPQVAVLSSALFSDTSDDYVRKAYGRSRT